MQSLLAIVYDSFLFIKATKNWDILKAYGNQYNFLIDRKDGFIFKKRPQII